MVPLSHLVVEQVADLVLPDVLPDRLRLDDETIKLAAEILQDRGHLGRRLVVARVEVLRQRCYHVGRAWWVGVRTAHTTARIDDCQGWNVNWESHSCGIWLIKLAT